MPMHPDVARTPALPPSLPAVASRTKVAIICGGVLLLAVAAGQRFLAFLDIAGLLLTTGGTIALLVVSLGLGAFKTTSRTLLSGPTCEADATTTRCFLRQTATYALACGYLGCVLGMMLVLFNLENLSQIGPGLSLALLSQVYGVVIALLAYCASTRWERRMGTAAEWDRLSRRTLTETCIATGAGTASLLMLFMLLYVAMGPS
ncbi:MAG: MotA/TolQ/ExbB proton channel family protein [Phycisphaerales bacterium]|nr:MotA/TolQ/ExbB proton channel family protein [Phycisphaerales bacterium]